MCDFGWPWLSAAERQAILAGIEGGRALGPPRAAQVDWTDRCNLGCFYCTQKAVRGLDELDLATLDRLFDELDELGVRSIQVAGGGEPLVHRDILGVLDSIDRHRLVVGTLVTNGRGLEGALAERVLEVVSNRLIVSLNSFGPVEYQRTTGAPPAAHGRLLEAIRRLCSAKHRRGGKGPTVSLQYLVHDGNAHAMTAMLREAESLGVDAVVFNPIHNHPEHARWIGANQGCFADRAEELFAADHGGIVDDVQTVFADLNREIVRRREDHFASRYPAVVARHRRFYGLEARCPLPWYFLHVKATGDVFPCCFLIVNGAAAMGSVHASSLRQIWQDQPFCDLRRGLSDRTLGRGRLSAASSASTGSVPDPCANGSCIIQHLPYIDDEDFYRSIDCLGRGPLDSDLRTPLVLEQGRAATLGGSSTGQLVHLRINGRPFVDLPVQRGSYSFTAAPDDLDAGYHLIEVVGDDGLSLGARRVLKV